MKKISKKAIGNFFPVTYMILEMNFIIFYNANPLSKTVSTSSQATFQKVQIFLNLITL